MMYIPNILFKEDIQSTLREYLVFSGHISVYSPSHQTSNSARVRMRVILFLSVP